MKEKDYSKSIEVFSGSPWEAEIIKGLLESKTIRCVDKDGIMGPLTHYIPTAKSILGRICGRHRAYQSPGRER